MMVFNPLLFNTLGKESESLSLKSLKTNSANYLFSDIIKVYAGDTPEINSTETITATKQGAASQNQTLTTAQQETGLVSSNLLSFLTLPGIKELVKQNINAKYSSESASANSTLTFDGNITAETGEELLNKLIESLSGSLSDQKTIQIGQDQIISVDDIKAAIADLLKSGKPVILKLLDGKVTMEFNLKQISKAAAQKDLAENEADTTDGYQIKITVTENQKNNSNADKLQGNVTEGTSAGATQIISEETTDSSNKKKELSKNSTEKVAKTEGTKIEADVNKTTPTEIENQVTQTGNTNPAEEAVTLVFNIGNEETTGKVDSKNIKVDTQIAAKDFASKNVTVEGNQSNEKNKTNSSFKELLKTESEQSENKNAVNNGGDSAKETTTTETKLTNAKNDGLLKTKLGETISADKNNSAQLKTVLNESGTTKGGKLKSLGSDVVEKGNAKQNANSNIENNNQVKKSLTDKVSDGTKTISAENKNALANSKTSETITNGEQILSKASGIKTSTEATSDLVAKNNRVSSKGKILNSNVSGQETKETKQIQSELKTSTKGIGKNIGDVVSGSENNEVKAKESSTSNEQNVSKAAGTKTSTETTADLAAKMNTVSSKEKLINSDVLKQGIKEAKQTQSESIKNTDKNDEVNSNSENKEIKTREVSASKEQILGKNSGTKTSTEASSDLAEKNNIISKEVKQKQPELKSNNENIVKEEGASKADSNKVNKTENPDSESENADATLKDDVINVKNLENTTDDNKSGQMNVKDSKEKEIVVKANVKKVFVVDGKEEIQTKQKVSGTKIKEDNAADKNVDEETKPNSSKIKTTVVSEKALTNENNKAEQKTDAQPVRAENGNVQSETSVNQDNSKEIKSSVGTEGHEYSSSKYSSENSSDNTSGNKKHSNDNNLFAKEIVSSGKNSVADLQASNDLTKTIKYSEVVKEISKFILKKEKSTVTLNIEPESFGKIKVTLDIVENSAKVVVEVENEAVKKMVENNVSQLFQSLNQNGVALSSLQVSTSDGQSRQTKNQSGNKKKFNLENEVTDTIKDKSKVKSYGYNTYEFLA